MLQSPPKKRSKLNAVTASSSTEHSIRSRKRSTSFRRSHSAPALRSRLAQNRTATDDALGDHFLEHAPGFSDGEDDVPEFMEREILCPQNAHPRNNHRYETADQNSLAWDAIQDSIFGSYVSDLVRNTEFVHNRKLSIQASVQQAISLAAGCCPCCPLQQQQSLTEVKKVEILWVGSQFRFTLLVPIHLCHNCGSTFTVNPLQASCFPSTPVHSWDLTKATHGERPMWFDLSMLKEVDIQLHVIKRLSMDRLSAAIMRMHAETGCAEPLSWDTFRKRLGQSVLQLGYVLQRCDDMSSLGAKNYPSGLLGECGGCWTVCEANQAKEEALMLLHSVYVDWCFKLPHLKTADKSGNVETFVTRAPLNARFFVPDSEVLEHLQLKDSSVPLPDDGKICSDFKADQVLGRMADGKYDITSLGVCLCRHGFVMYLMNSFTGERHAYATLFMQKLLEQGIAPQFIWYDINCRWSVSFKRWLSMQPQDIAELAKGIQYPLPPFHLYAHSVECQRLSSSVRMTGAGRGNGEPHENFNADFGQHGKVTQYMTRQNRQGRIERAAHLATLDKALRLPAQLCRMEVRATSAKKSAQDSFDAVMEQLRDSGMTASEIQDMMVVQAQGHAAADALSVPWEAQLAEGMLIVHKAELADGDSCTPGLALLFEDAAFAKLSASSAKVKSAAAAIRRLKKEHAADLAGQDLKVGSADFEGLLAIFVQHKVLQLQHEIERMVRVRMDADALMPALAERPADQARLKKTLLKSASAIDSKAARLKDWVTGSFIDESMLAEDVLALRDTAATWDITAFRHGVFPWHQNASAASELSRAQLISRLVLHNRERRRCQEELELLGRERQSSLQLYDRQATALRGGLAAIEQELTTLQAGGSAAACTAAGHESVECQQVASSSSQCRKGGDADLLMGRRLLMEQRWERVSRIASAAKAAFASTNLSEAMMRADECALDFVECAPDYVVGEDGSVLVVAEADDGLTSDEDLP